MAKIKVTAIFDTEESLWMVRDHGHVFLLSGPTSIETTETYDSLLEKIKEGRENEKK